MDNPFPLINACMNGLSMILLVLGFIAIKKEKNEAKHKKLMVAALCSSAAFLASYLTYHYTAGHNKITATGTLKTIYYLILFPHLILATAMVPMILKTFYHAFKDQREKHLKIARITFPIWLYVSFTGVVLYFFIYVIFPDKFEMKSNKELLNIEKVEENNE